jgi:phosphoribosylamine--glycine ligase
VISGLAEVDLVGANQGDTKVFHAGTALQGDQVVATGGRVLCVCALADSVKEAAMAAYSGCDKIHWDGTFFRHDIGYRAIAREQN